MYCIHVPFYIQCMYIQCVVYMHVYCVHVASCMYVVCAGPHSTPIQTQCSGGVVEENRWEGQFLCQHSVAAEALHHSE